MIESIQFKNFKCLRDSTLPLSPCTILVGPNGSGKSTVLQALETPGSPARVAHPAVVTLGTQQAKEPDVEVKLNWGKPFAGSQALFRWLGGGVFQHEFGDLGERERNLISRSIHAIRVYSLDAEALAAPVELKQNMELARNGAGLAGVLTRLQDRDRERFEALTTALGQWLPEFDDVLFDMDGSARVLLLRTRQGQHAIPAKHLSQGTLLALGMLALAYLPDPPSLVALEEPDRGMHPYLLRLVQDTLYRLSHPDSCGEKREPVQVIATTHSPYFLDLFKDHPEEIVVANKVGADVQFQRLTDRPHAKEMLGDDPLGEVWYTGVLGGVPGGS